jgi:prepilin-type N-terminal cleavage/methylation domain-containing protein
MKRNHRAFTLIELVISVFLLGIIVYFLYGAVASLQRSNVIFGKRSQSAFYDQKILSMLQKDLFFAKTMTLSGHENTFVQMQTNNSMYDIDAPYVVWMLKPDLKKLVRFESTLPFTKMNAKNSPLYHMSIIPKRCEKFKIYQSKKKENILIYIKFKGEDPLVYEFYKPMKEIIDKNSSKKPKSNASPLRRHR